MENNQVLNIEVKLPEDIIIVKREDYIDLLKQIEKGVWWSIDEVSEMLHLGRTKLINDILLNPKIKKEIDVESSSDGFVIYPKTKGQPYKFLASKTREYFEENHNIFLY